MCVASCGWTRQVRVVLAQPHMLLLLPLARAMMPTMRRQLRQPLASARARHCWWDAFFAAECAASNMQRVGMPGFTRLTVHAFGREKYRRGVWWCDECNTAMQLPVQYWSQEEMSQQHADGARQEKRSVMGRKKRVSIARTRSNLIISPVI